MTQHQKPTSSQPNRDGMKVKICGLTSLADARYAAAAGADYLGFVLVAGSPRFVEPGTAAEIIEWISGPETVGIFVDEDAHVVNDIAAAAGFDLVQLHGDESVEMCRHVSLPVIKAFSVGSTESVDSLRARMLPYRDVVAYFLLDAADPSAKGGTGKTTNWDTARALAVEFPLFLAGGLRSDNVAHAIRAVRPAGVDVSSGLESAPGKKDFASIDAFLDVLQDLKRTGESA